MTTTRTTTARTMGVLLLGLATGIAASSCATESRVLNADHCANQTGDAWCGTRYEDGSRPFCILGNGLCGATPNRDGCVEEQPAADECYSPCGASMSVEEDATCLPGEESTGGSTSTGEATTEGSESGSESSTTGPMPCGGDEECTNPEAPFCGTGGECGTCDGAADPDGACAGADPMAPVCVGDACVQCTEANAVACAGVTPLCDDATNTCVPCTAHDQCGEAACNLYTGACLPADAVVHVGPGQEFAALGLAVGSFAMGAEGTVIVHEPMASYDESVVVSGGRVLAFLAASDATVPPIWARIAGGGPQLAVTTDSTVLIDGLRMSSNGSDVAIQVDSARAWVDRSRIVQNSGGGIVAQNAAELTVRNCFVGSLGDVIGVEVSNASATVLYSTVTASTFGSTPAMGCTAPVAVEVRNSIIVSQGGTSPDELSCAGASVADSATEATVGAFSLGWFANYNAGDYSLTASGAMTFADIAEWAAGDPPTDIEGDLRPDIDGTPDHAGADLP